MNAWLLAVCLLLPAGLGACAWRACRGEPAQRLAGITLGGTLCVAVLMLTAQGLHRTSYQDLALVLALIGPAGTLVFARCLAGGEREEGSRG
ncbi:monovalent cation/H+ antiporter complex subunit F [Streptomyces hoynatensis]|uniref:Uncharacterized protein n=1 Tax=Streptomyces hoynatensis TaxID=1141874 RepID=A0A3A9Z086_9ACTN|nr:monovalent cation/H+ antiporter complex subunit F [Streptomyces hoynatensis]RKN40846.1 hypothetical protein D7294_17380 [Streptomyces hoynatensis]